MDFTNINDPAGVSALLERLRSSQAWADLQVQQTISSHVPPETQAPPPRPAPAQDASSNAEPKPSVASLLSQLKPVPDPASTSTSPRQSVPMSQSSSISSPAMASARPAREFRNLSFQQTLPHLVRLSDDRTFVEAISKLRCDQGNLEKQLWEERQALHTKQAEKVKIAVTKANMLGTGISEREANAMRQVFEDELTKFDRERVLPAWDGLIARQQATLEQLGVPAMFVSDEGLDRERQQRVIQVLEGIVGPNEADRTP